MSFLRVAFLEFLLCVHVVGLAVLFRRFFPRESPWLGFVVPIVALLAALNFFEHFVALSNMGWLLPLTLGGLLWTIIAPGYSWEGLRLPTMIFVGTFTLILGLKCIAPDIPSSYCEGAGNLTRVLNYSLGGTLPQTDCWMPPYDYGGYYSFQHYGASILKRMFFLDLGTAYNVSFAFLLAWSCLIGAGVAYAISGKTWISVATILVLLAGSTGSMPILLLFGYGPDYALSTCLNSSWDDHVRNPFWWICLHDQYHPGLTLVPPTYSLYWPEFHATLGGASVTMASLLASAEVFKAGRFNWSWIALFVLPMVVIITSAWFFFVVFFLCAGSLTLALMAGRRPENWRFVVLVSIIGFIFLWPFFYSLSANSYAEKFSWTAPEDHTPLWMFLIQWWPIYLPWIFLLFVWNKLDLMGRWFHAAIPILFMGIEFVTFGNRTLTTEKMWGAVYGAGLITLLPQIFMQERPNYRGLTAFLLIFSLYCFYGLQHFTFYIHLRDSNVCYLQGDYYVQHEPQRKRILQVLSRYRGETILPGKAYWAYNEAPLIVGLSENRCYIAYINQEIQCGHGGEAEYRGDLDNAFYAGTMTDPLSFLRNNNITAVLIWPDDQISDNLLQQFQTEIGSEYFYVDCKGEGEKNAGVFIRQPLSQSMSRAGSP